MYFLIEASVAVLVAFLINMFVVAVFAHGLFGHKNREIVLLILLLLTLNRLFGIT